MGPVALYPFTHQNQAKASQAPMSCNVVREGLWLLQVTVSQIFFFSNCQGKKVSISLVTFKTLCSYCLLHAPNGMPGFFSASSLFQFFMFILLIFLAELSAAILAFIFRENVSILLSYGGQNLNPGGFVPSWSVVLGGVSFVCRTAVCSKYQQTCFITTPSLQSYQQAGEC